MVKKSIFTADEVAVFHAFNQCGVEYMVIGLAAAALQGAPVVTQDIDLWFEDLSDPNLKKALKKVGSTLIPSFDYNPPLFTGEKAELFDIVLTVHGLGKFADEKANTILVDLDGEKVRVLKLERIVESKKAAKRKKDLLTIPVLEDALAAIRSKKKKQR